MVGDQGHDLVGLELVAAGEVGQFYQEGDARDGAAGVLDELAHGAGGAAGGEEVVGHEDAGALRDGVGVGFQGVRAVLQLVGGGDGIPRQLVWFAGEDEAFFGAVGQGRAEHEAAGLGGEDAVVDDAFRGRGQGVHGGVQGAPVLYQGGDVLEGDAGAREVGDRADVGFDLPGGVGQRRVRHGTKVSITLAIISSFMRESTEARWRALVMASPTRPSSPLLSSGFTTCLKRAASRSTAAMMPRRWRGWMEYFAISRAMRAISASRWVSSPLRPITPTLISSSTKRISVSRVSASSSRVYVLSSRTLERSPAASPEVNATPPSIRFLITLSGRYSLSCSVRMYLRSSISWDEKSLYPPRVRLRLIKRLRSRYRILLTERAGNSGLKCSTTSPMVKLSLVALYLSRAGAE